MNLLITGGCGFIGSNFINYIHSRYSDIKIVNIDAMYYCANENNVHEHIRNSPNYKLIVGNIRCMDLIKHILKDYNITHVVHFAAQSHVGDSFEYSLKYTQDNVLGTHVLLEACRQWKKIELFIHVSTDEVYGESMLEEEIKMHENSVLCPTNPYAATKAAAELIAKSYFHSFGLPIIITRGNNVYGPNQYPEKLIPRFIQLLQNNERVTIQGDGSSVRSFIYIDDVIRAFDIILHNGKIGEIYNIGGDNNSEYNVLEIAHVLIELLKPGSQFEEWIEYITDRPFNDKRYYISNEKLLGLGWNMRINLQEGLEKLLSSYNLDNI